MGARHGPEEVDARNALHGRVDGGESINQADGDVVAVHIVALVGPLAGRACDNDGRCEPGIEQ